MTLLFWLLIDVMNDKKYEINQFDIDASQSQFEIANKLWDIIGESV
jgi:hypothetical protein